MHDTRGWNNHWVNEVVMAGMCLFVRKSQKRSKTLSDFPSDIVTRCPAALGVVAASACCWSPVFTGAE